MTLQELKLKINQQITNSDLIMAVLSQLKDKQIPKDPAFIYTAFYNLKRKHSKYFANFIFDECSIVPHSDELNNVLFRLEASLILPTNNPSYKVYDLGDKDYLIHSFKKFSEDEQKEIVNISRTLDEYIEQHVN